MTLLEGLKPQKKSEKCEITAYDVDLRKFRAALAFLNKDLNSNQGVYAEEDLFSSLLTQLSTVEGFDDFFEKYTKPKRGRKPMTENN